MANSPLPAAFRPEPPASETEAAASGLEAFHELRVRIPTDVHRQLLALKILRGVTLADTVVVALDRYFAERAQEPSPKDP